MRDSRRWSRLFDRHLKGGRVSETPSAPSEPRGACNFETADHRTGITELQKMKCHVQRAAASSSSSQGSPTHTGPRRGYTPMANTPVADTPN